MGYLSVEEILRLHFQVIEDFGGSHGIRDEGRVKSAALAPSQAVFGEEQYKTVYEKAAVYLRNIVADHPFIDGNKRTGITVCGIFLARNKCLLTAGSKSLEDFALYVATSKPDIAEIAKWLEAHSRRI